MTMRAPSAGPPPSIDEGPRAPVTVSAIVAAARELLVQGGPENVGIRQLARSLRVSAPALYKHTSGRGEIVDLLAAACLDELTGIVIAAREELPHHDHRGRFLAAGRAWYRWAHSHPAEHALIFATPAVTFDRPTHGQAHAAGTRLGRAFQEIAGPAALAGQLRAVPDDDVPIDVATQLVQWATTRGLSLRVGQLWTTTCAFQDLMGLIMTESFGQLGYASPDRCVHASTPGTARGLHHAATWS
jgi:AcrR family transcriptional regulator